MRNALTRGAGRLLPSAALLSLVTLLAACGERAAAPTGADAPDARPLDARPLDARPLDARPLLAVRDARNAGAPGFYFLPPIAAQLQNYPGAFDGTRLPTVEICRWSAGACVGPLVASYSRAAGTIALDAANQLFRVDWPTAGASPATRPSGTSPGCSTSSCGG